MGLTTIFLILFQFYLVFTVIVLLLDNREPSETFAWILIFLLLPGFGFGLYLMFGRNWRKSSVGSKRLPQFVAKKLFDVFEPLIDRQDNEGKKIHDLLSPESEDLVALLYNNSHSVLTANNDLEIFYKGEEKFKVLKKDLLSAQKFIYMEYFIWRFGDKLGQEIKDILIQKVKEGVQVKILYDFSGCFFSAKRKYIQELRDSGIEIYPFFNYLSSFKIHTINYRNHRKIVIVDGKTAYVGGMNLGQEYIDGGKKFNSWRDTHLRLTGESVGILQAVFAIDWYNTTSDENVFDKETFTSLKKKHDFSEKTLIQIPTSGFDSR